MITGQGQLRLEEEVRINDGEEAYVGGLTASTGNSIHRRVDGGIA
ncbi:hypothetical protein [Cohnella lupini]|nr:hypothetical protein [Cohnella lupini]